MINTETRLPDTLCVEVRGQRFDVLPAPHLAYWTKVTRGEWEPETFTVLDHMLTTSSIYVDCGAWIGPTVLYAAAKGAKVVTFECDPVAIKRLKSNLSVNPNIEQLVTLVEAGLADGGGPLLLHTSHFGNSQSSVLKPIEDNDELINFPKAITVQGMDALQTFERNGWLDNSETLIKIDTEGAEYEILRSLDNRLSNAQCSFYISFHQQHLRSRNGRPDRLIRLRETINWMDKLWHYRWWQGTSDTLVEVDKDALLELAVKGRNLPSILFTRNGDWRLAAAGQVF